MIGNAPLDQAWLWGWQEGFQASKATFQAVLDLLRESDDFVFTASSAACYAWIEPHNPRMFAEIKQRIAEGRWQIVGGWWVQPDRNLPGDESFVRQALCGQRYFQSRFGVHATVGYNDDVRDSYGCVGDRRVIHQLQYFADNLPVERRTTLSIWEVHLRPAAGCTF